MKQTATSTAQLSRAVLERDVVQNLDELQRLMQEQKNELEGIKEAFIAYAMAMEQIIKDLENAK